MQKLILAALITIIPCSLFSQPLITFQPIIISGLTQPVDAVEVNDGTGRLFIVERTGKIKIWDGTSLSANAFIDVSGLITSAGGEQGLLSMAFHPDYVNNGYFYIYFTDSSNAVNLVRYTRFNAQAADPATKRVIMTIPKPFTNHNGAKLIFGTDGFLYFGTGDGGGGGDPYKNAQNKNVLLGKMLRIDVNNPSLPYYSIPPSNPYVGSTAFKQEIIAYGLRNPWRWSFDKQTGDMWIADVGQNTWEEVNVVPAANILDRNYQWRCFEGTHVFDTCTPQGNNVIPIFDYEHGVASGGYSVTGGYVYRGAEFPLLQGYYIFCDYVTTNGWITKPNGAGGYTTTRQSTFPFHISSFAQTHNGTLYALKFEGIVYKVIAASSMPVRLSSFTGKEAGNKFEINWIVQHEERGDNYFIEKRNNLTETFTEIYKTSVSTSAVKNTYTITIDAGEEKTYYRLKIQTASGQTTYSDIISSNPHRQELLKLYKTGNNFRITLPKGTSAIEIFDASGRELLNQKTTGATSLNVPAASFAKGMMAVRALINGEWQVVKMLN